AWWSVFGGFRPNWTGRFDDAIAHAERWRGAGDASGNATMELGQRWVEALARGGRGEYNEALQLLDGVVSEAERIGEVFVCARALNTIGWLYGELQDHERALDWNRRGVEAAVAMNARDFELEGNARLNLGDTLFALGRLDEAEQQYARVERVVRDPRPPQRFLLWRFSQHLFHSDGQLWLARGQAEQALAYAEECLNSAEASESRKYLVMGRRLRCEALLAAGRLDAAELELTAALDLARELGNPPQLWKAHAAFGQLRAAQGKADLARLNYQEALAVVKGVAQGLDDERLREKLLTSAEVTAIRTGAGQAG
ncbi:MAG: hypothetical protein M3O70_08390, partial [Actinomycetota bacterium]|nr:hypothetical protein [Actinomycetota bacterium]